MADYISVTTSGPTNVTVQQTATNVQVNTDSGPEITVIDNAVNPMPTPGVQVGPTQPVMLNGGIWVQTFDNGDITMWIEDGT